jgi:hypothetical protein
MKSRFNFSSEANATDTGSITSGGSGPSVAPAGPSSLGHQGPEAQPATSRAEQLSQSPLGLVECSRTFEGRPVAGTGQQVDASGDTGTPVFHTATQQGTAFQSACSSSPRAQGGQGVGLHPRRRPVKRGVSWAGKLGASGPTALGSGPSPFAAQRQQEQQQQGRRPVRRDVSCSGIIQVTAPNHSIPCTHLPPALLHGPQASSTANMRAIKRTGSLLRYGSGIQHLDSTGTLQPNTSPPDSLHIPLDASPAVIDSPLGTPAHIQVLSNVGLAPDTPSLTAPVSLDAAVSQLPSQDATSSHAALLQPWPLTPQPRLRSGAGPTTTTTDPCTWAAATIPGGSSRTSPVAGPLTEPLPYTAVGPQATHAVMAPRSPPLLLATAAGPSLFGPPLNASTTNILSGISSRGRQCSLPPSGFPGPPTASPALTPSGPSRHDLTLTPSYLAALASSIYGVHRSTDRGTALSSLARTGSTDSAADILAHLTSGAPSRAATSCQTSHVSPRPSAPRSVLASTYTSIERPGSTAASMPTAFALHQPSNMGVPAPEQLMESSVNETSVCKQVSPLGAAPGHASHRARTRSVTFKLEDLGTASCLPHQGSHRHTGQGSAMACDRAARTAFHVNHMAALASAIGTVQPLVHDQTLSCVGGDIASLDKQAARKGRRVSFGDVLHSYQVGLPCVQIP